MKDDDVTCLMPSPFAAEEDGAMGPGLMGESLTPAIGVRSVGDTHFGETKFDPLRERSRARTQLDSTERAAVWERQKVVSSLAPSTTSRKVESTSPKVLNRLKSRPWRSVPGPVWGLLFGGSVGILAALFLRANEQNAAREPHEISPVSVQSSAPPASLAPPSTAGLAQEPAAQKAANQPSPEREESPPGPHQVRAKQTAAHRFVLNGECESAAAIYEQLAKTSSSKTKSSLMWRNFAANARLVCATEEQ